MSDFLRVSFSTLSIAASLREYFLLSIPQSAQVTNISFFRIEQTYRSYLPHQLTRRDSILTDVAKEIIDNLYRINSREPYLEFQVKLTPSGYIDLLLCAESLSFWLDQLPQKVSQLQVELKVEEKPDFLLHYTHARCCSLLRLGEQEGLIRKDFLSHSIPWLELTATWEKAFFWQLLEMTENPITTSSLMKLAQVTLQVERYSRIWGDIAKNQPNLAKARLALFALSRYLLAYLVNQHFNIELLSEL